MKEKRKSSTGDAATPKSGGAKTPNKKVKAAADAEDDDAGVPLNDTERAYLAWMKKKGVKLNGVSIGRFPHTGRGCVATRDIKEGDVLVEVPEAAIITADGSVAGSALVAFGLGGEALLHEYSPRLEREALVLAVMAEMSRGEESEFAPYLAALPTLRATHSPLGWSGAELAELEGTSALNRMTSAEDESLELPSMTADHWKHVARPFLQRNPEFARMPGAGADDDDHDDEDDDAAEENARRMYLHATALVAGFSFTLGEDDDSVEDDDDDAAAAADDDDDSDSQVSTGGDTVQAMVPFWDMLNHVEPESSSVRLDHDEDANTLRMIAIRPHAKGEEVFNTYGAAGDAELLRRYGFVMRRNPHGGGVEVSTAECLAAAEFARFESDMHEDDDSESDYSDEDDEDDDSEDRFEGKMPPISDSDDDDDDEEEVDSEEDEEDGEEEDAEGDSDDEDLMAMDFRPGQIAREETLERLRMLRRWGILRNSKQTFEVSRTGKPSLALRYVARVLSMNRFQFRRLLAADAYERGERDDQEGAYSDEEDEDDDGFGDYKPLTVEQVWNGDTVLTDEGDDDVSEDEDEELQEREDQMGRVSVTLIALAERALTGGRYPTDSLRADMIKLKRLGAEAPGEREHAGLGGWRGAVGAKEDSRRVGDILFPPSWRDEERRAMHRQRMALVVRIREKRALVALKRWAANPCRTEDDILPPLLRADAEEDVDATLCRVIPKDD